MEQLEHCTCKPLDNGIFQFVWHTNKRQAVDDFFTLGDQVINSLPPDAVLRFIVEFTSEMLPPLKYLTQRAKNYNLAHPDVPARYFIAYIHDSYQIKIAEIMLESMRAATTRRFFKPAQFDDAVAWLLEQPPKED